MYLVPRPELLPEAPYNLCPRAHRAPRVSVEPGRVQPAAHGAREDERHLPRQRRRPQLGLPGGRRGGAVASGSCSPAL